MHVRASVLTPVQGPRANALKYAPSLCAGCNGTATQPFDLAYDRLIAWVFANENEVLSRRVIDLAAVYGDRWTEAQSQLYKYFVKSFGCRLVDAGAKVPQDLVDLLPMRSFSTGLGLTFGINEDVLAFFPGRSGQGFIGKGHLVGFAERARPDELAEFEWSEHVSWLTVEYWYMRSPPESAGALWAANGQRLRLGSFAPLSPEQREEARQKGPLSDGS